MNFATLCLWLSVLLFLIAFFLPTLYRPTNPSRWKLEIAGFFFLALALALGAGGFHL